MKTQNLHHDETAANHSTNQTSDYETYRIKLEDSLTSLFNSPLIFLRQLINLPKILSSPTISFRAKFILVGSSFIGLLSLFWVIPKTDFSENTLCINVALIPFAFIMFSYGGLLLILAFFSLPKLIRFSFKPYPWKVSLLYFLWMCLYLLLITLASAGFAVSTLSNIELWKSLFSSARFAMLMAIFMGFTSAGLSIPLTRKRFIALFITSHIFAIGIYIATIWPIYNSFDNQNIFSLKYLTETILVAESMAIPFFWFGWLFLGAWNTHFWPALAKYWVNKQNYFHQISRKINEGILQIEKIQISKTYWLSLIILGAYLGFTLLANINPKQLDLLVMLNLNVFEYITLLSLIIVTFQYLFIPKELARVKLDVPIFVARPVLRALLVLFLLFTLWWIFHATLMMNINNESQILYNTNAYRFLDGQTTSPSLGDFMFFTFALMTNSGYLELHPSSGFAKIHVMIVSVTGLVLLAVFIAVALSQQDSASQRELGDNEKNRVQK